MESCMFSSLISSLIYSDLSGLRSHQISANLFYVLDSGYRTSPRDRKTWTQISLLTNNGCMNLNTIASTNLIVLLEDEVFADFFNTFLSLPVFGQMPIYIVHDLEWILWPELPCTLIAKYKGLLTWLEKYRLPYFCKTTLCYHYMLCKELIGFIRSPEGAKMMSWKTADQWLLYKCVGSVRGMWRFCAYLSGTAGEELLEFWIIAERILGMDETNDKQKDTYLSLLLMLKATHLQEGSSVLILCNMNIKSLVNFSVWHPKESTTRREILSHMQKMALFKLQSYWLPNFYIHCKVNMVKEEKCQALLQEYENLLSQEKKEDTSNSKSELPLKMKIRRLYLTRKPYCSKKIKKKMWHFIERGTWTAEHELPIIHNLPPQKSKSHDKRLESLPEVFCPPPKLVVRMGPPKPLGFRDSLNDIKVKESFSSITFHSKVDDYKRHLPFSLEGVYEKKFTARLRNATPLINQHSLLSLRKVIRKSFSFEYLHWALTANSCAGNPFEDYLKSKHYKIESRLLHLWKDLDSFLTISISTKKGGNLLFRHTLGNRICELYLNEDNGPILPLTPQTIWHLKELLPSGNVIPWIAKAQKEICKILASLFDDFLDLDDHWFLIYVSQTNICEMKKKAKEPLDNLEYVLLCKRIQESLLLCQGLTTLEEIEIPTDINWQMIATQDLKKGGSLQVELHPSVFKEDARKMSFEELCKKYPKMAIEKMSEDFKKYSDNEHLIARAKKTEPPKKPHTHLSFENTLSFLSKGTSGSRKPSIRPKHIIEVLQHPAHMDYFRNFLKGNKVENMLNFIIAVQKAYTESDGKLQKELIDDITKTFFHNRIKAEKLLHCSSPFIRELSHMHHIPLPMLIQAQSLVLSCLEDKWFKSYQDLFPAQVQPQVLEAELRQKLLKKGPKTIHLQIRKKKTWVCFGNIIRTLCKFLREIKKPESRMAFENFLLQEMNNRKENVVIPGPPKKTASNSFSPKPALEVDLDDVVFLRRRIHGHKTVIVNFLVNDLSYFIEVEK
ncbi:regulator of G-protein signaling protein-like isoform X2 [Macrotis lagotis]